MATIVEATVTFGDDKFTVVLDPRNMIRGWEDRTYIVTGKQIGRAHV